MALLVKIVKQKCAPAVHTQVIQTLMHASITAMGTLADGSAAVGTWRLSRYRNAP